MDKKLLTDAGVDYEDGVNRFAGHDQIYEKYLRRLLDDHEFENLTENMQRGDYEAAFRNAHTLKGVVGNLSMNVMYEKIKPFVELLRNNANVEGAVAAFPELQACYQKSLNAIRAYFA